MYLIKPLWLNKNSWWLYLYLLSSTYILSTNKIYSPTDKEILEAKEILEQMKLAEKKGKGAIAFNGKLLDIVSIKQAQNIVKMDNMIKNGREGTWNSF